MTASTPSLAVLLRHVRERFDQRADLLAAISAVEPKPGPVAAAIRRAIVVTWGGQIEDARLPARFASVGRSAEVLTVLDRAREQAGYDAEDAEEDPQP
jgi:hypothetical protein